MQSGGSDCGLFSLAFAASLCAGEDPSQILSSSCWVSGETEHYTFPKLCSQIY